MQTIFFIYIKNQIILYIILLLVWADTRDLKLSDEIIRVYNFLKSERVKIKDKWGVKNGKDKEKL